jgi:hypothetical protein
MRVLTSVAIGLVALLPSLALGHGGGGRSGFVPPAGREPADPPPPPDDGTPTPPSNPNGIRDETLRARVVVALHGLAADRTHDADLRAASVLALARIGGAESVADLAARLLDEHENDCVEVRRAALFGLGVAAGDASGGRASLVAFLRRRERGDEGTRQVAALALGLAGGDGDREGESVATLVEIVADANERTDTRLACLAALGLAGDERAVPELVAMVRTGRAGPAEAERLGDAEIGAAVVALGMIGKPGERGAAADALAEILTRKDAPAAPAVRCAAVIALGHVATSPQFASRWDAADLLRGLCADAGATEQERLFAFSALGGLAAAPGDARTRADVVAVLRNAMQSADHHVPACASIALGAVGRAVADEDGVPAERDVCEPLRTAFHDRTDADTRRAAAYASGLARDPLAAAAFVDVLRDDGADDRVRGCCALAIGMIGDTRNTAALLDAARAPAASKMRIPYATAAALLSVPSAVDDLVSVLRDRGAGWCEADAAAEALGRFGDDRAVEAILAVAADADLPHRTRTLAVTTLGRIGDRRVSAKIARAAADLERFPFVASIRSVLELR